MSLKDKGNDEFKKGNINKAIELYLKYLEEDHQDNNLAYNNLAFCYFKLKEYSKCIEACQNSLELVRQNPKVYYRLYMTYKQMGDQYQTFINAHLFLKYYQEDSPNAKSEALKIIKEFKEKFIKKKLCTEIKVEQALINDLDLMGNSCLDKSLEDECEDNQSKYLEDTNVSTLQKMKIIKDKIIKQYSYGINLAYLLINITKSQAEKKYIIEEIAVAKRQYLKKSGVDKLKQNEEASYLLNKQAQKQESAEDSENLFQQVPKKPKAQQSKQQTQTKSKFVIKTQQSPTKTVIIKPTISGIKPEDSLKKAQSEPLQTEFQRFMIKPPQSHDVFNQMFSIIQKILSSDLSPQIKRGFLQKMQKSYSQMNILKYSLTDNESKQMFQLLSKNGLQKQFKIYKSK